MDAIVGNGGGLLRLPFARVCGRRCCRGWVLVHAHGRDWFSEQGDGGVHLRRIELRGSASDVLVFASVRVNLCAFDENACG